jgi:cation diffusion facilitator CzcD-associated flavoprotein CzcO
MSFSDIPFPYGPFVPHHVPRQYLENYLSAHKLDGKEHLSLNTTVEDLFLTKKGKGKAEERWKLTLRKHDPLRVVDSWWDEEFDAVIIANGHYAVPFVIPPFYK